MNFTLQTTILSLLAHHRLGLIQIAVHWPNPAMLFSWSMLYSAISPTIPSTIYYASHMCKYAITEVPQRLWQILI